MKGAATGIRWGEGARHVCHLLHEMLSRQNKSKLIDPSNAESLLGRRQKGTSGLGDVLNPAGAKNAAVGDNNEVWQVHIGAG